jgi:hypothetical protein
MNNPTLLAAAGLVLALCATAAIYFFLREKKLSLAGIFSRISSLRSAAPAEPEPVADEAPKAAASAPPESPASPSGIEPPLDPDRRKLGGAMVFLGFLFGFFSLSLRVDLPPENPSAFWPFLAYGMLVFLGGMLLASHPDRRTFFEPALEWIAGKMSIHPAQLVCLASGILLAVLATVAAGTNSTLISPWVSILSWLAGIGFTVLGGWHFTPSSERKLPPRSAFLWAAVLVVAGILLRAVLAGRIPVVLTGDEGSTGIDALQWRLGNVNNPFGVFGWHPFPSLYFFIESLGIAALGRTIEALRWPSALAGGLTVGALYLVVRAMYSHRHGLAAALFLGGLHLHMHFSRLGVMNIWDGLWYTITLGALWYGWHSGKRGYWILAGLSLGIGQYFYATIRTLPVAVILWLAVATVLDRSAWRRNLRNVVPMLAACAAVALPLAWFAIAKTDTYLSDIRTNSILGPWMETAMRDQGLPAWRIFLNQLNLGFGGFFSVDLSFWYRPESPILRTVPAVFFFFGLATLCLRLRDTRTWIPLLWIAAYGMIVSLSESAPAAQRLPGVGPAVALVVGFGTMEFLSILANLFPMRKIVMGTAAVLLAGGMAADDLRFYFFDYTPQSVLGGRYDFVGSGGEIANDIVAKVIVLPGQWQILFFNNEHMGFYSNPALRFLAANAEGMDIGAVWGSPDNPEIPSGNLFFVFMTGREAEIPQVRQDYPGGILREVRLEDGTLLYTYYEYRSES